jgi:hypothetical protein
MDILGKMSKYQTVPTQEKRKNLTIAGPIPPKISDGWLISFASSPDLFKKSRKYHAG